MGTIASKLSNWSYERRVRQRHIRDMKLNPNMQSVRIVKGATVVAIVCVVLLKHSNAALERQIANEYRNIYLESHNLKQIADKVEWDRQNPPPVDPLAALR